MAKKRKPTEGTTIPATQERRTDRHVDRKQVALPTSLYAALKAIADKNRRPVSWEIRLALEAHVEANGTPAR